MEEKIQLIPTSITIIVNFSPVPVPTLSCRRTAYLSFCRAGNASFSFLSFPFSIFLRRFVAKLIEVAVVVSASACGSFIIFSLGSLPPPREHRPGSKGNGRRFSLTFHGEVSAFFRPSSSPSGFVCFRVCSLLMVFNGVAIANVPVYDRQSHFCPRMYSLFSSFRRRG